ncbi:MAG: hypothetical protein OK457_05240 [Thaumarchaeota archaeon]|nr:hypothetical protein [Nitrososphaerota archaeon]
MAASLILVVCCGTYIYSYLLRRKVMKLLLGLGNKARHGKDTAASAIKDWFEDSDYEVRIFKFAEALYEECRQKHSMVGKDTALLQRIGSERRKENPDYWVDQVAYQLEDYKGIAIISDVRYGNEADWIHSMGGYVVNVSRLNPDGSLYVATDRDPNHLSEVALDGYVWDGYIKAYSGEEALLGDLAVTYAEHFLALSE